MRLNAILSVILAYGLQVMSHEVASVGLVDERGTYPPDTGRVEVILVKRAPIDATPLPQPAVLIVSGATETSGGAMKMSLVLRNLEETVLVIPISSDGRGAYKACGPGPMEVSYLSYKTESNNGTHGVIHHSERYGCEGFPGSTVRLQKGDWLMITGISEFSSSSKPIFGYSLSEFTYHSGTEGRTLKDRQLLDLRSN